jgi:hypothetical protein
MSKKPISRNVVIEVGDSEGRGGSLIMLELESDKAARDVARKFALASGRRVRVLDDQMIELMTIPAATKQ